MDALDGRMARLTGSMSDLGGQLDSLCDAISFCLAPAVLVYSWHLHKVAFLGFAACACYLVAGIFRLARFNLTSNEQSVFFLGLPVTAAGCFLATLVLNTQSRVLTSSHLSGLLFTTLFLGYLMISPVRFPSFKYVHKNTYMMAVILAITITVTLGLTKALFFIFCLYLSSPILSLAATMFLKIKNQCFSHK